jgi:hypothetical protein
MLKLYECHCLAEFSVTRIFIPRETSQNNLDVKPHVMSVMQIGQLYRIYDCLGRPKRNKFVVDV